MTYLARISANALSVLVIVLLTISTGNANDPFIDFYVVQNSTVGVTGTLNGSPITTNPAQPYADNSSAILNVNYVTGGNSEIAYIPNPGFLGVDKFTVTVTTNGFNSIFYSVRIFVVESIVKANNDYYGAENGETTQFDVLSNDYSSSGIKVLNTIALSTGISDVQIVNDMIEVTTEPDFAGIGHISYTICDALGTCDVAELNINIIDSNVEYDTTRIYTNRRTDVEFPFYLENRIASNDPVASKGNYSIIENNAISYSPNNNSFGLETLTFEIDNGNGNSLYRTIEIVILNKASNIYAFDDVAFMYPNETISINVLDNDYGNASVSPWTTTNNTYNNCTIAYSGNGVFNVTPNTDYTGIITFKYKTISSGTYEEAYATIYVSNFEPELTKYHLSTPIGVPLILDYAIPFDNFEFTCDYETENGGNLEFDNVNKLLIYTPVEIGMDAMEVQYCLDGNVTTCVTIEIEIDVLDVSDENEFCSGTECIWPGDANNDGMVNMSDILAVGMCIGEKGYERDIVASDWMPYNGDEWDIADVSGMPLRHMDCNGDGIITHADAIVIENSYNNRHKLNPALKPVDKQSVKFDQIDLMDYTGPNGEEWTYVSVQLALGTSSNPLYDINGVGFKFIFDTLVQSESLNVDFYADSWFTLNNNPLESVLNPELNDLAPQIDAAISRTNMEAVSGYGIIGRLDFIIVEDLEGFKDYEDFFTSHFRAFTTVSYGDMNIEEEAQQNIEVKIPYNLPVVSPTLDNLTVYPNPVGDWLNVKLYSNEKIETIEMFNISGKSVSYVKLNNQNITQIDMSQHRNGLYFVKVTTKSAVLTKKVEVFHK